MATLGQEPELELGVWAESTLPVGEMASWEVWLQSFWLATPEVPWRLGVALAFKVPLTRERIMGQKFP